MLTTMKVSADMLWVVTPPTAPTRQAASRFPVHRLAMRRRRRLASAFRFFGQEPHPDEEEPDTSDHPREQLDHGLLFPLPAACGESDVNTGKGEAPFSRWGSG